MWEVFLNDLAGKEEELVSLVKNLDETSSIFSMEINVEKPNSQQTITGLLAKIKVGSQ